MKTATVIALIFTVLTWVFLWPLAMIWAINTLFAMGIAYTFWNWLAMIVLTAFFGRAYLKVNKD